MSDRVSDIEDLPGSDTEDGSYGSESPLINSSIPPELAAEVPQTQPFANHPTYTTDDNTIVPIRTSHKNQNVYIHRTGNNILPQERREFANFAALCNRPDLNWDSQRRSSDIWQFYEQGVTQGDKSEPVMICQKCF